jgi:uroporphyrin-III C-methyltransferase
MTFHAALDIAGRRVVCTDGRAEALPALSALLAADAWVDVIAPTVATSIQDLATRGLLRWDRRLPRAGDLEHAALVLCAEQQEEVRRSAARHGLALSLTPSATPPIRDAATVGSVLLVGGGPGDPGLLTVAGQAAIAQADVIVVDRLAPLAALRDARPDAEIVDVAKIPRGAYTPQEQINDLLVRHARAGHLVVRLKGGDSFVFGRGGEEWQACAAAGIPVRIVPGVTSAVAGPALAGIPLTHRSLTQGFTVVSGHVPPGDPASTLDWAALARANTTLVIMMGIATLPEICAALRRGGLAGDTPAATVANAGLPGQRLIRGTLSSIAGLVSDADLRPPAITVVGAVAGFQPDTVDQPVDPARHAVHPADPDDPRNRDNREDPGNREGAVNRADAEEHGR